VVAYLSKKELVRPLQRGREGLFIRGFSDKYVGSDLVDPCGTKMSVGSHVVVTGVDDALVPHLHIKHGCAQHLFICVSERVVGGDR